MSSDSPEHTTSSAFPPDAEECARIRKLLKRLPKSCLHTYDLENQFPLHLDNDAYYSLLFDLQKKRDKDWRLRAVAAWALGISSNFADAQCVLTEHLRDIVQNRLQTKPKMISERFGTAVFRTFVPCYFLLAALLTFLSPAFVYVPSRTHSFEEHLIWGCMNALPVTCILTGLLLFLILPLAITASIDNNNEARIMAVLALYRQNALEALPELLEGACDKSLGVSKQCRYALTDILPQITAENRDLMPLNSEELIGKILEDLPDLALGSAILDYLEKFGTGRNCAAVEFYLKCLLHKATAPAFSEVYAKGQRVFVVLQERRGRNREGEHLLRHSIAPNAQPDELLRPAADSQTAPSEQPLRASDARP